MSDDEFEQLVFEGGELASEADDNANSGRGKTETVQPNAEDGYRLAIKPGAIEANEPLVDVCDEHGEVLSFGSRPKAEAFARRLSADGGALRVQAAAPNDSSEDDGYLLAAYDRSVREPATVDGNTWTFDIGANLYGALGETVVVSGGKPPVIECFVEEDLDAYPDDLESGLRISVESDIYVPSDGDGSGWIPDCRVTATDGWNGEVLEKYWCEIKTGDGSFERGQVETMRQLATEARVLKVRVLIDDLPDQSTIYLINTPCASTRSNRQGTDDAIVDQASEYSVRCFASSSRRRRDFCPSVRWS